MEGVCFQSGPLKILLDGLDEALHPYSAGVHYREFPNPIWCQPLGDLFWEELKGATKRQVPRKSKVARLQFLQVVPVEAENGQIDQSTPCGSTYR